MGCKNIIFAICHLYDGSHHHIENMTVPKNRFLARDVMHRLPPLLPTGVQQVIQLARQIDGISQGGVRLRR
jgi:hypothetical protein